MFTHLHTHSNFSFLDGGSSVQSLVERAKEIGYDSLALTDHNGLYGAVRFYQSAHASGIKPILGAELFTDGGHHIVLLAKNLNGYSNLCKIITRAQLSHEKGHVAASIETIAQYNSDLFCLSGCRSGEVAAMCLTGRPDAAVESARRYAEIFGRDNYFIEMQNNLLPGNNLLNAQLNAVAKKLGIRAVATNNVHYANKADFKVQDVLTCVQTITTLDEHHPIRKRNCEYYMKTPKAMTRLFVESPNAIAAAGEIAAECNVDLSLGTYRFPNFEVPTGETPYSYLCKLCFQGLSQLYSPITPKALKRMQHELSIINDMGFAEYFLVVWEIVRQARQMGIRCSGRGSAADSQVAYCLGITIVDPLEHDLLFERFLNPERKGMPDIDIDFDANRRDEIISYIYQRFGEDKVAMVCTVSTLNAKSAIRDIGKAMDFPPEEIDRLASVLPHTKARRINEAIEKLPELRSLNLSKLESMLEICEKVDGFPRHLSVHLGGMVISGGLLTDLVPLEWATKGVIVSQFDKDDIEALGLVKMDILGLKNLSAIEEAKTLIKENHGIDLDVDRLSHDDPAVYEMLRSTDTVGIFQIESPGMRGLLGRLQPTRFDDITANIALFRPGPMQADMINPFIARRHGIEPVTYLHPCLKPVLRETYGVILYQEQVLRVSHAIAGFSMGQSDSLRRAMTTDRSQEEMEKIKDSFVQGAIGKGVHQEIAELIFSQLRAFAAYGFCKAHAASFAIIAYQTAYLKTHYPAEFMAAILSCQPMGFYPPNVILEEARRMGIGILGPDVNRSGKKFSVENGNIRIGLMQIKGISDAEIESILQARMSGDFVSLTDFCRRTAITHPTAENLINSGAFDFLGHARRKLLWLLGEKVSRERKRSTLNTQRSTSNTPILQHSNTPTLPLDVDSDDDIARLPDVPELPLHLQVRMDYEILGMSPACHPMVFYRQTLRRMGIVENARLRTMPNNTIVKIAGVVVTCMRPPTRSGVIVVFITLEDESGLADVVVFPKVYEKYGPVIFNSPGLMIEGKIERNGQRGLSIIARRIAPLKADLRNEGLSKDSTPYPERKKQIGHRSWTKGQGV